MVRLDFSDPQLCKQYTEHNLAYTLATADKTISRWISNHMAKKVWNEITYLFSNLNGSTVEVWEWVSNLTLHIIMDVITFTCRN